MSINYDLHSESILIRNFVGKVTVQDIIDSWEYLRENKLVNKNIKGVLNNLSNCELTMNLKSFEIVLSYIKKQDFLKGVKIAVVSNSSKIIIFPILAEKQQGSLKIKPFSTFDAAVNWILIG